MTRPTWDEYFLGIMDAVAARATCDRGRSGAVLVRDRQILATGYVGTPAGIAHCDEGGHLMRRVVYENGETHDHCVGTTHAEMNAIIQCARKGVSTLDATLYCRMEPCLDCCKAVINAGIVRVVAQAPYHGAELTRSWFQTAGVEMVVMGDKELY